MKSELGPFIYSLIENTVLDYSDRFPDNKFAKIINDVFDQCGDIDLKIAKKFMTTVVSPTAQIVVCQADFESKVRFDLSISGIHKINSDGFWFEGYWKIKR